MGKDETIELQILTMVRQGHSRVEFKRRASEILCRYFSCSGMDIYINEGSIDYTWQFRHDSGNSFQFMKKDEESETTVRYRKLLETLSSNAETVSVDRSPPKITVPISIDDEKAGIVTYIREKNNQFSREEERSCTNASGILAAAISFRNTQAALRERIKELTCLYEITKIMQKAPESIEQTLQEAIQNIPCAFQYDDIATSRIFLDGKEYTCGKQEDSKYSLRSDIVISDAPRGYIEVLYKTQGRDLEEKPFLLEEQNLLDGIAKQLSLLIEENEAAAEKQRLESQLRHADRLATIGQLAAGVAHEINEPLANILGFSELIKKESGLSEQSSKDLDKIIRASMFARDTVKKLLVFASQIQPGEAETDINDVISEGIQFFEMRCEKNGIEVTTDLDPSVPKLTADQGQLNQVFINLFVNAMQAMPDGGTIHITTRAQDTMICFSIRDSGPGINEEIRDKIFLPFFTTKETGKGTGLGLAVVHGIVHAYKGKIEIESNSGEGSTFTVYLPLGGDNGSSNNSGN